MLDQSYGIIPVREIEKELFVLLVEMRDHWGFPKGHPEPGESIEETIVREVYEETRVTEFKLSFDHKFFSQYSFMRNDVQIDKRVDYFLAIIDQEKVSHSDAETKQCTWYCVQEALSLDRFHDIKLLKEVLDRLEKQPLSKIPFIAKKYNPAV